MSNRDLFKEELDLEKVDPVDSFAKQKTERRMALFAQGDVKTPKPAYIPPKPEPVVEESSMDIAVAETRGIIEGVADTVDLFPMAFNASAELAADAYDVVTGDGDKPARNFDDVIHPEPFERMADMTMGTVDSYKKGPMTEIAVDTGQAIPAVLTMAYGMARYGAKTLLEKGAVHPMFAIYTTKFAQSVGIDIAAISAGEVVEEIVEEVTEEDSVWGTIGNVTTSILGGWKLAQTKLLGASDEAIKKSVEESGGVIASKAMDGSTTLPGGQAGNALIKGADLATRPVKAVVDATKGSVLGSAKALDKFAGSSLSPAALREWKDNGGSLAKMVTESKVMNKYNRGYIKKVMDKAGDPAKETYRRNLEVAKHLGLRLDTYQLTGMPEFEKFSIAVSKLDPEKHAADLKHNIDMIDSFLDQKGLGYNEASNNALQLALRNNKGNTDDALKSLQDRLVKERQSFIKETTRNIDPVRLGQDFLDAYKTYESELKALVGKGFEKAIPADTFINTKFFNNHVKDELNNLQTAGLIPAELALPKIIRNMMEGTAEKVLESGVRVTPKVTAREMQESIVQLGKARKLLTKTDPEFIIKDNQFIKAIGSMEDTLAQKLTPKQYEAYEAAKDEWKTVIGDKFNQNEVKKFTLKDQFNELKSNGQELIQELLNTAGASESRVDAINKLLNVSFDDMMKMAHRLDDVDVKSIGKITAAQDVMELKIKDYIVQDYMGKVLMNPNRAPDEIMEEYLNQHARVLSSVISEPLDLNKMGREVIQAGIENQKRIDQEVADALNTGAKGERLLEDYVHNSLINNASEVNKFTKLLNDPEKLKNMGMSKEVLQDTIAANIVETAMKRDSAGSITESRVFEVIRKNRDNLVKVIGEERVVHMEKFQRLHDTSTLTQGRIGKDKIDLEQPMVGSSAIKALRNTLSTKLMIAHGFVSPAFAYSMAAIRVLGGLKSTGYQKYMQKMMTDPDFFEEAIQLSKDVKNHEDIVRTRLYLAHHGIQTEAFTSKESEEQAKNLADVSIELENSPYPDFESIDSQVSLNESETTVEPQVQPTVEPQVQPTVEPPVQQTDDVEASSNPTLSNEETEETSNAVPIKAPSSGDIIDGYRFKGGDPNDKANWQAV